MKELLKKIVPKSVIRLRAYLRYISRRNYYRSDFVPIAKELSKETGKHYLLLLLDMGLSLFRYTASPQEYQMYRFYEKSPWARDRFLTQYRNRDITVLFNPGEHRELFRDKIAFYQHFSDFLGRRWLYAPDAPDEKIEEFLREQKEVIVKPHYGSYGIGVKKLGYSEIADMKEFCKSARKDGLVLEEIVIQHPHLSSINSASVNTLRVNTMMDKKGVPHILIANLRMGRGQTVVDNMYSGGVMAQIDLDTGVLFTVGVCRNHQTYVRHPTSGVVLPGFPIPHWKAAKEMVLHAAKMVPQTRWIGWDVAITEKGSCLIEGNHIAGEDVMQLATQTGIYPLLQGYL